jgi:hypothetical protein
MQATIHLASCAAALLCVAQTRAGTEQLAISSQIQYSRIIQGAQDPVTAFVYNNAPAGSDAASYKVYATFPYGSSASAYVGTKLADGGSSFVTLPFTFDSSLVTPGNNIPISVTGIDTVSGASLTQSGSVTVLAHPTPALVLGGQIVYLTSRNTVKFQTPSNDIFGQAPPAGGEAAASYMPQMLGDPPGEPTAKLDLDSISTSGSSYITTNLQPFFNLPSDNDPAEALPFEIDIRPPTPGDYMTTFMLHYSDEDDLPGADLPGSEMISFSVECNITPTVANWTVTTVPEPATLWMLLIGILTLYSWGCLSHGKLVRP